MPVAPIITASYNSTLTIAPVADKRRGPLQPFANKSTGVAGFSAQLIANAIAFTAGIAHIDNKKMIQENKGETGTP